MTVTLQTHVLAIMLTAGAAWGFVRLATDALDGALKLSVWIHRKLAEQINDR